MLQKRNIRWLIPAVCLCILCTSQARAGSIQDRISHTGNKINELEGELDRTDQQVHTYQQEQQLLESQISDGQARISRISGELDNTLAQIKTKQEEISQTQVDLAHAQEECAQQYEQMKKRIRFMYENSMDTMLIQILESGSLTEALRRAEYFQSVVSYDRDKLEEYKATTKMIAQTKKQLVAEEEALHGLEQEQSAQLEQIDQVVGELKNSLRDKMAQIQNSQALRQKYEQELERQKAYEAELERQKAQEDLKRQEEIRRQKEELARQRELEEQRRQEEQQRQQQQASQQSESSSNETESSSGTEADTAKSACYTASAGDLELLSTIIFCEAGNQSYEGQLAVGSVIMNRVASNSFPNSISGVIYQGGQFSPVASGRFAQALASGEGSSCRAVAQDVLNGNRNVDCLYFRVNNGLIDGLVIGDHVFY